MTDHLLTLVHSGEHTHVFRYRADRRGLVAVTTAAAKAREEGLLSEMGEATVMMDAAAQIIGRVTKGGGHGG